MERRKSLNASRPKNPGNVTNLLTKRRCKTNKNLRLFPWETKYQHTLFSLVNPIKAKENTGPPNASNDSSKSTSDFQCGEISSLSHELTQNCEPEKNLGLRNALCITDAGKVLREHPKPASKCESNVKGNSAMKSEWYDAKNFDLDKLFALPVELKLKEFADASANNSFKKCVSHPTIKRKILSKSKTRCKNAFERGSLSYESSKLNKLFSYSSH